MDKQFNTKFKRETAFALLESVVIAELKELNIFEIQNDCYDVGCIIKPRSVELHLVQNDERVFGSTVGIFNFKRYNKTDDNLELTFNAGGSFSPDVECGGRFKILTGANLIHKWDEVSPIILEAMQGYVKIENEIEASLDL
jgi:hypothetical protein